MQCKCCYCLLLLFQIDVHCLGLIETMVDGFQSKSFNLISVFSDLSRPIKIMKLCEVTDSMSTSCKNGCADN